MSGSESRAGTTGGTNPRLTTLARCLETRIERPNPTLVSIRPTDGQSPSPALMKAPHRIIPAARPVHFDDHDRSQTSRLKCVQVRRGAQRRSLRPAHGGRHPLRPTMWLGVCPDQPWAVRQEASWAPRYSAMPARVGSRCLSLAGDKLMINRHELVAKVLDKNV